MMNSDMDTRDGAGSQKQTSRDTTDELLTRLVFKFGRSLGAMRSTTQALLNGGDEDRRFRREMLGDMDGELRELQRLLDNVVQLRAFEKGTFRLRPRTVLPAILLSQTVETWQRSERGRGFDWEIDIGNDLAPVIVDPDKLQQVLDNILANAVNHSPGGTLIEMAACDSDGRLRIRVETNAGRVSAEDHRRLTELFYTGLQQGRFPTGTGLGLHVARRIVEAAGGAFALEIPEGDGDRLAVVVELPGVLPVGVEAVEAHC